MKAKDLKNSILQMAVEGKLVPQDPADEPADVLLERIREEKHRLIAEGKAKFPKDGESIIYIGSDGSPYEKRVDAKGRVLSDKCIADEVPFEELPEGWAWARLENCCDDILVPQRDKPSKFAGDIPWCRIEDVEDGLLGESKTGKVVDPKTVQSMHLKVNPIGTVLCSNSATIGVPAVVTTPLVTNQRFIGFVCAQSLFNWYLYYLFLANHNYICGVGTGTTQSYIARSTFERMLIPLPPLAEQRRIVGRVEELVPIVGEYGELEDAREALDAALPGRLRKSVLQMAVQGKLAPQDPADEPAGALLGRIREQRAELVRQKKMKAPKGGESVIFTGSDGRRYEKRVDSKGRETEPVCIEDEIPFEIPEGWEWARLSCIMQLSSGLGYKKDNLAVKGKHMIRVLRGGNIGESDEPLIKDNDVLISAEFVDAGLLLRDGQIITPAVTSLENVGKAAIVRNADGRTVCGGFVFYLTPYLKNFCHSEYLHRYLSSPGHITFCKSVVKKSGQAFYNLSKSSLSSALIAIPPLAEQHRIVAVFKAYTANAL